MIARFGIYSFILLTLTFCFLVVLPLDFYSSVNFLYIPGLSLWEVGFVIFLSLFYLTYLFIGDLQLRPSVVRFSFALSIVLFVASLLSAHAYHLDVILSLTAAIWFLPFLDFLLRIYGHPTLIFLGVFVLLLHAQWGIGHFIVQHNFGLSYLGEVRVAQQEVGVAKFRMLIPADSDFIGKKLIRAYGPYTHSNDFAGSLVIGLTLIIVILKFSYSMNVRDSGFFYCSSFSSVLFILAYVLMLGILLSFSRNAFLAAAIASVSGILFYIRKAPSFRLFWRNYIFCTCITLVFAFPLLQSRFGDVDDRAALERIAGYRWSMQLLFQQPLWRGVGPGNYIAVLQDYLTVRGIPHTAWDVTNVHSIPLLLMVEWGVLPALTVIVLVIWYITKSHHSFVYSLSFVPLVFLDHYFLTQSAPLLWAVFLVAVSHEFQ